MNYASVADMACRFDERELIQLTDREHVPPAALAVAVAETALADAQALVDGYLGQRYRLPIIGCRQAGSDSRTSPPLLTRLTCDIARYNLYKDLAPEAEVVRRYKEATRMLEALAAGEVALACPLGDSPVERIGGEGDTVFGFSPRQITDDSLRGYFDTLAPRAGRGRG